MTSSEINAKISYYSGCVSSCEARMSELNTKIDQATQIYDALIAYRNKAGELNEARRTKLSGAPTSSYQSKTLETYYEGMNDMLTGVAYQNAYEGIDSGCTEVMTKINEWNSELSEVTSERNAAASSESYWRGQLRYAEDPKPVPTPTPAVS